MRLPDDAFVTGTVTNGPCRKLRHSLPILTLALSLRLLVLWNVVTSYPPRWFFMRGIEMGLLAKSLLAGQGLSSPFGGSTGPTAFIAPVYPLLVAGVFRVFGEFSRTSEVCLISAQILLNLLTLWLIMHIAHRLFGQLAATIAGLIWACSLTLIWMPTIFWETSFSCCLLTGVVYLALSFRALPASVTVTPIILGAYCAIAGLLNPALLPALLAISVLVLVLKSKSAPLGPVIAALTFAVVFSPWPLRNAHAFHAFIPLRTTVGFELWMGNRPGATGFLDESIFPMFNQQELDDYNSRGELAYVAHKSDLARNYIYEYPGRFLSLSMLRTFRFWCGTGTKVGSPFFIFHALLTTLSGFGGLFLLFKARRWFTALLFSLPLALFPLPYLITHAEFRYRLVIDPLLTICSGYAIAAIYQPLNEKQRESSSPCASSSVALTIDKALV